MTASVLETTGILAHVVGPSLAAHTGDILPLILDALQDAGEGRKRDVAVLTLAQVRALASPGFRMPALLPGLAARLLQPPAPTPAF